MSLLESLPDGILCHIVSLIISELRKLPRVSVRFREICLMPHWYTKFVLELNPTRFVDFEVVDRRQGFGLCFEPGAKQRVIIENVRCWLESDSQNTADSKLCSLPWRHFSVFELHLIPNGGNNSHLQECIDRILPHFGSLEILPSTKRQSDVISLSDSLFSHRQWDGIYHLSLNGKIEFESNSNADHDISGLLQYGPPGLHSLFTQTLRHIEYLELNFVCYPDRDWISESIFPLKKLVILDLWRCQWKAQSAITLTAQIELFRVFGCTTGTRYDFSRCADRIRVISTDCLQCTGSPDLLHQTSRLMARDQNGERVHLMISHVRSTRQCLKALKAMIRAEIERIHIVYTRDAFNSFERIQDAIEHSSTPNKQSSKKRNLKMIVWRQESVYYLRSDDDDDDEDVDDDEEKEDFGGSDQQKRTRKQITVLYGKLSVNIFAASKQYALYRKLLKIGRLRGTFLWDQTQSTV